MTTDPTADFAGCNRKCRLAGAHARLWGECEHGVAPEPTVSLSRVYTDHDGYPSIGFDEYTVQQLADLIEPGLRSAGVRVSAGRYSDLAHAAAVAIVTRHRKSAVPAAVPPPAPRAGVQAEAADRIRRELVCCDLYARVNDAGELTFEQALKSRDWHDLCYWGEASARLAEERPDLKHAVAQQSPASPPARPSGGV
ncbi:hypothetical protein ACWEP4_40460 [Streptomyces sp. NPDC004227]